jgi:hypothetical protein
MRAALALISLFSEVIPAQVTISTPSTPVLITVYHPIEFRPVSTKFA